MSLVIIAQLRKGDASIDTMMIALPSPGGNWTLAFAHVRAEIADIRATWCLTMEEFVIAARENAAVPANNP